MKYKHIKNGIIISAVTLSLFLILAAVQYVFYDDIPSVTYKLISLTIAIALLLSFHVWSSSYEPTEGLHKTLLSSLYIEVILSSILLFVLIFNLFDFTKTLIILGALQIVHLIIYLSNMFLYDERPVHHKPLTDQEIMEKSNKKNLSPSYQDSSD